MPALLTLLPKNSPVLREIMPQIRDFKDPALAEIIHDMCYSIQPEQLGSLAAGMAANQWGIRKRIFIFAPMGSDKEFEVMINPSWTPYLRAGETKHKMVAAYEGCFSIPLTVGLINRYDAILASYYLPTGKKMERLLKGWEARVFQHETDHLDGRLYDGKLEHHEGPEVLDRIIFNDREEMQAWLSKERERRNQGYHDKK